MTACSVGLLSFRLTVLEMSSKPKPRLKAMRVKLTREPPSSIPVEGSRMERVSTEPDCREAVLLHGRRSGNRSRNLSMSVEDRKDEARSSESTLMKLVAAAKATNVLRCSLQNGDRGWLGPGGEEGRAGLGRARLSLAIPKEDRRFEFSLGGYQSPASVVTDIAGKLESSAKAFKLQEDLKSAQGTIAALNENVQHLTVSLQQQTDSNACLLRTLDSLSPSAQSSVQSSILSLQSHLDSQLSLLSSQVSHTEARFTTIETQVRTALLATLKHLSEANDCISARISEEAALRQETSRLQSLLRQAQDYASVHITALEQDNAALRQANTALEADFNRLEVENEALHAQLLSAHEAQLQASEVPSLQRQLTVQMDDLQAAHSVVRMQQGEILALRTEVQRLAGQVDTHTRTEQQLTDTVQRLQLEMKDIHDAYRALEDELRTGNMRKTMEMVHRERRRMAVSMDIDEQDMEVSTVRAVTRCISPLTPDVSPRIDLEEAITSPSEDALDTETDKTPIAIDLRTAVLTLIAELPSPQGKSTEKMISTVVSLLKAPDSLLSLVDRTRKSKLKP